MIDQENGTESSRAEALEPVWSVWRQDDNGNVFLVQDGLTEADALRLVRDLESKGHKQTYWVRGDS
jgi:hypothetical protein